MRFLGMRHLALRVADVERSALFYERAFGMRRFGPAKHGGDLVPLVSPGLKDQLSLTSADASSEMGDGEGELEKRGGVDHFGFLVSPWTRIDRLQAHLESCGATFLARVDVAPSVPSLFFRDPDGYRFQVVRFPWFARFYVALLPLLARLRSARA